MKRTILTLLLSFCVSLIYSQTTIYKVDYTMHDGSHFAGYMELSDDTTCMLRVRNINGNAAIRRICRIVNYRPVESTTSDGKGVLYYEPDNTAYPYFAWYWSKDDSSDLSTMPCVVKDPFIDPVWGRMNTFREITLREMDENILKEYAADDQNLYTSLYNRKLRQEQSERIPAVRHIHRPLSGAVNAQSNGEIRPAPGATPAVNAVDSSVQTSAPAKMHVVLVAATNSGDIGLSCSRDLRNMRSEMQGISRALDMEYIETVIEGTDLSPANVRKAIYNLNPGPDDVVLFYYSGHGFRFENQEDNYPCFSLTATTYDDPAENYMTFTEAKAMVEDKHPRLGIILSDCCNSLMTYATRSEKEAPSITNRFNNNYDTEKLRKLFLEQNGIIYCTSSLPGEKSWGSDELGGYFTKNLLQNLRRQISVFNDNEAGWRPLLEGAMISVSQLCEDRGREVQHGFGYIDLH